MADPALHNGPDHGKKKDNNPPAEAAAVTPFYFYEDEVSPHSPNHSIFPATCSFS
jgi:hypothetical protein